MNELNSNAEWAPGSGLPGQGIVVTGAASGIGRTTALCAGRAGMNVVLVDRNDDGLREVEDQIKAETSVKTRTVAADLREIDQHEKILSAATEIGGASLLFHAAGVIIRRDQPTSVTEDDWDFQVDVNQKASWFLTRAFCESLIERNQPGSVVLVSSISASLGIMSGSWVYAATKGAVLSMVRGFAKTYASHGIRVNALSPGIVETPMVRSDVQNQDVTRMIEANVPLGRTANPEEIAQAGFFLLSNYASYVTGNNLNVDGGWLRQ